MQRATSSSRNINNAQVNTQLVDAGSGYNSTPRVELTGQQPADSAGPASPIDFGQAFTEFRSDAAQLAPCPNTVAMTDPDGTTVPEGEAESGQQIRITLTEGSTDILDVTGDDLNDMANLTFLNPPTATAPLLINVDTSGTGGVFDWDAASRAGIGGAQAPYILWNFGTGTTALTIASGDSIEGSIFAPNAAYTDISPANVEGQIVARQASLGTADQNGGAIHDFPFDATLTCETTPVPNPTTDQPTTSDLSPDEPTSSAPTTAASTTASHTDGSPTGSTGELNGTTGTGGRGGTLATTGSSALPLLVAAGGLLLIGAAVIFAALRRRGDAEV